MNREREVVDQITSYEELYAMTRAIYAIAFHGFTRVQGRIKRRHRSLLIGKMFFSVILSRRRTRRYFLFLVATDKTCSGPLNLRMQRVGTKYLSKLAALGKHVRLCTVGERLRKVMHTEQRQALARSIRAHDVRVPSLTLSFLCIDTFFKAIQRADKVVFIFMRYHEKTKQAVAAYIVPTFRVVQALFFKTLKRVELDYEFVVYFSDRVREPLFLFNLYFFFFSLVCLDVLEEHQYSDFAMRSNTMDAASLFTSTAIEELRLRYNHMRQERVTKVLLEIVATFVCM